MGYDGYWNMDSGWRWLNFGNWRNRGGDCMRFVGNVGLLEMWSWDWKGIVWWLVVYGRCWFYGWVRVCLYSGLY